MLFYRKLDSKYWPYVIESDSLFPSSMSDQLIEWCEKNFGTHYLGFNNFLWAVGPQGAYFKKEDHAVLFMMTWGYE